MPVDYVAIANACMRERGYVVMGYFIPQAVGAIDRTLWTKIDQPMRLLSETDRADWDSQIDLAERVVGGKASFRGDPEAGYYYRAITD
jgi:hypothetical protein